MHIPLAPQFLYFSVHNSISKFIIPFPLFKYRDITSQLVAFKKEKLCLCSGRVTVSCEQKYLQTQSWIFLITHAWDWEQANSDRQTKISAASSVRNVTGSSVATEISPVFVIMFLLYVKQIHQCFSSSLHQIQLLLLQTWYTQRRRLKDW